MLTRAQAVAELERIYEILPQIASALADVRKPVAQYAKTSYFKDVYGQSMGTVKNRKYGIMNQIKLGRYPKDAIMDRYCSDECAGYASKERARTKMREIQEEHRKFITETRQKKNMKKPGKKSKQYRNELIRIAAEAREHGMSYGQYVGLMYCEERDEIR